MLDFLLRSEPAHAAGELQWKLASLYVSGPLPWPSQPSWTASAPSLNFVPRFDGAVAGSSDGARWGRQQRVLMETRGAGYIPPLDLCRNRLKFLDASAISAVCVGILKAGSVTLMVVSGVELEFGSQRPQFLRCGSVCR